MSHLPVIPVPEFVRRSPSPALAGLVRSLWYLRAPSGGDSERILPIPYVHVIVNLGEPYVVESHGGTRLDRRLDGPFIAGLQSTYLVNRNPRLIHHVGAELEPFAWRAFGASPFADDVRDATEALPALNAVADGARHLSPDGAIDLLEAALTDSLTGKAPSPVAVAAVLAIAADPSAPMSAIAAHVGVRASSLPDLFKRATGTTPKLHAEVYRFHRFLDAVAAGMPLPTWTQLVANTSYYDQPHFNRTFVRFAGVTPREYLAALGEDGRADPSFIASQSA